MFFSKYGKAIESIDQTYMNRLSELKNAAKDGNSHLNDYISLLEEYEYFLNDRITDLYWERGELEVELVERNSILYCIDPKRRNEGWSEWVNLGLDNGKYKRKLAEVTSEIEAVKAKRGDSDVDQTTVLQTRV